MLPGGMGFGRLDPARRHRDRRHRRAALSRRRRDCRRPHRGGRRLEAAGRARDRRLRARSSRPALSTCTRMTTAPCLRRPDMAAKASQGVTTVVTGNCGISLAPLVLDQAPAAAARPDRRGRGLSLPDASPTTWPPSTRRRPALNAACLVGHSTLRVGAMPALDRPADARPRSQRWGAAAGGARRRRGRACRPGSIYAPAFHAPPPRSRRWPRRCSRPARSTRRICATRPSTCSTASTRASPIGRDAGVPVVISHHKTTGVANFGRTAETLPKIEAAIAGAGGRARRLSLYRLLDRAAAPAHRGCAQGADHLVEERARHGRPRARRIAAEWGVGMHRGGRAAAARRRDLLHDGRGRCAARACASSIR